MKWSFDFFSDFFFLIEQRTAAARVLGNIHYSTERFPRFSRSLVYTQWTLHIFHFKCFVAALEDFRVALMKWVFISVLMWQARVGTWRTLSSFFGARWHTHTHKMLADDVSKLHCRHHHPARQWMERNYGIARVSLELFSLVECLRIHATSSTFSEFTVWWRTSYTSHTMAESGEEKWKF